MIALEPTPSRSRRGLHLTIAVAVAVASGLAASVVGDVAGMAARALCVCALLGVGALALARRRDATASLAAMTVLERHPLGKDVGLALFAAGRRRLVVAYGPGGAALVTELPAVAEEGHP